MKEKKDLIEFTKSFVEFKVSQKNISHTLNKTEFSHLWNFEVMIPYSYKTRDLKTNQYKTVAEIMKVDGSFNSDNKTIMYQRVTMPETFRKAMLDEQMENPLDLDFLKENLLREIDSTNLKSFQEIFSGNIENRQKKETYKDYSFEKKLQLANDLDTDIQTQILLSRESNPEIRIALSINPNARKEILTKLSKDASYYVRTNVASHSNTPLSVLKELSKDEMTSVKEMVSKSERFHSDEDFKEIFESGVKQREETLAHFDKEQNEMFQEWIDERESLLIANFDSSMEEETETHISKARTEVMLHTYHLLGNEEFEKQLLEMSEVERTSIRKVIMENINKSKNLEGETTMKTLQLSGGIYTATNKKTLALLEKEGYKKSVIKKLVKEGKLVEQNPDRSFVSGTNNIVGFKTSDRNLMNKTIQENQPVKYIIDSVSKKSYNLQDEQSIKEWEKVVSEFGTDTNVDFEKGTFETVIKEEKSSLNKNPSEEQKKSYKQVREQQKEEKPDYVKEQLEKMLSKASDEETKQELLKFYREVAKFNNFSFQNILRLMQQSLERGNFDISYVQSGKKWVNDGVRINKGEKAMKVLAPKTMYEIERGEDGKPIMIGKDKKNYKYKLDENGKRIKSGVKFIEVPVFDASQTNAEKIGKLPDLGYRNKRENISDEMLDEILTEVAKKYDLKIIEKDLKQPNLGGYYRKDTKEIVINTGGIGSDGKSVKTNSQMLSTLFHELGHHLLHGNENYDAIHMDKSQKEGEAESVSYILSSHVGIEQNSHLYIKGWDRDLDSMKKSMNKIVTESRGVMNKIDFEKILKREEDRQIKILEDRKAQLELEQEYSEEMEHYHGAEFEGSEQAM